MAELHEQAEKDYIDGMKYKDIAEKHGVSINTIKSWKQRHKWVREKGAYKTKGVHTKAKQSATEKRIEEPTFEPVVESDDLTDKQQLFCIYYVKYRNKTKAYMKAYECSWKTANSHAYRLWEIEGVRKEIDSRTDK